MFARRALVLALSLAALLPAGCGTVCNLASSDPQVMGGLNKDLDTLKTFSWNLQATSTNGPNDYSGVFFLGLTLAEVGATTVGDFLTAPLLRWLQDEGDPPLLPPEPEPGPPVDLPAPFSVAE
jgi:hypothetical protein